MSVVNRERTGDQAEAASALRETSPAYTDLKQKLFRRGMDEQSHIGEMPSKEPPSLCCRKVPMCYVRWLLLDSRGVDVLMAYNPTVVMLSSLRSLFFGL